MIEAFERFFWWVIVAYVAVYIIFYILALIISNWVAKKLASKYFKKYWKDVSLEDCRMKSMYIWCFEVLAAIALIVLALVAHYYRFEESAVFFAVLFSILIISTVWMSSCDYIKKRFAEEEPEDCTI